MQPAGLRGQRRHPHWATLAGPAVNERDPGGRGAVRSDTESRSFAPRLANRAGAPRPAPTPAPAPAPRPQQRRRRVPSAAGRGGIAPAGSSPLSCCSPFLLCVAAFLAMANRWQCCLCHEMELQAPTAGQVSRPHSGLISSIREHLAPGGESNQPSRTY